MKKIIKLYSLESVLLILVGTLMWSLTMVKSGIIYDFGMGFWGPNGHDGVWHLSVIESLARGSWQMPVFAGEALENYHLGYDLLVAWLHKLTLISVGSLYFQIIPPILAFLIGVFAYKFVYSWRKSKKQAFWATFFVYFGGSLGWLVSLVRSGSIGGESLFWSQQSISTLVNPPFALSILLMFLGLQLLIKGLRNKDKKLLAIASFIFGVLIQIKVYAGILALGGLFVAGIWRMLKRRGIALMKVFSGALIISILLFFPLTRNVGGTVIFKPFWFLETMMSFSDRFDWPKFGEAMVNYKLGGNFIKGAIAYSVAFGVFIVGNFGTRLVKDIYVFKRLKNIKKLSSIEVFIYIVIAAGIVIPLFYIQKGTPWNTIQFMYYSLMFSGILVGVALGSFLEKSKLNSILIYIIVVIIVGMTIPTTIGTLRHYLPARPPAKLSHEELEALNFLSEQPEGVVLTYPFDRAAAEAVVDNPPRPLYLYESTAYVSAFAKKPVYLEDEVNLEITGYDWRGRRSQVGRFLESESIEETRGFLKENKIEYIYWLKGQRATLGESQLGITKIFENSEADVYKIN